MLAAYTMAPRLPLRYCALIVLALYLPRPTSSFFFSPSVPGAISRRVRTPIATTTAGATAPGSDAPAQADAPPAASTTVPPVNSRTAPPSFIAKNNVNLDGDVISSREGEPTAEELANENVIKIVAQMGTDEEVNWILWKCLGYRYDAENDSWKAEKVFPRWKERYPEPPDLLGVTRVYEPAIDRPVILASQAMIRSIPLAYKRSIVEQLRPMGFTGFELEELTPNRTRRAQAVNFLLYFREQLWGVPLEEVERSRAERVRREARENAAAKRAAAARNAKAQPPAPEK